MRTAARILVPPVVLTVPAAVGIYLTDQWWGVLVGPAVFIALVAVLLRVYDV